VLLIVACARRPSLWRACSERRRNWAWPSSWKCTTPRSFRRALACGARLVGVNNRNLRTLEVDVRASHDLAARLPADVVGVSESGLRSVSGAGRLRAAATTHS
jgi:hypothetical protein